MRQIKTGSADKSVNLYIIDSTDGTPETGVVWNSAGIDLKYRREGAAVVSITEATLASLSTAHADGGFLTKGFGNYRLDLPDAAWASGATEVTIFGTVTGMIVLPVEVQLVAYDPNDAVRMGQTALPNAAADAAGGLPISDAGGLALDTKLANTNEVTAARMAALTDWIDAGRLDAILDTINSTVTSLPSATTIADQVFDEAKSGHVAAGSFGEEIQAHALTSDVPTVTEIQAEMEEDEASLLDAIRDDLANGTDGLGALKILIDAVNTDLSNGTDGLGALKILIDAVNTDLSNGTDGLGALKTLIDAVNTDLSNGTDGLGALKILIDAVNTDLSNGTDGLGALKTLIDAVQTATDAVQTDLSNGTDGLGALKTLIDNQLITALTESYAADGSTATLAELLYMIWSILNSLKFVGTVGTSRKLDGATTAMSYTIDDADDPTDINRSA